MARLTANKASAPGPTFGEKIIVGLEQVVGTMKAGGMPAVKKRFTVRRVKQTGFPRPSISPAEIVAIRSELGVSQTLFAALLGVSPSTVRAWEQGSSVPSGIARRFLAEIRRAPDYWKGRVADAAGVPAN